MSNVTQLLHEHIGFARDDVFVILTCVCGSARYNRKAVLNSQ